LELLIVVDLNFVPASEFRLVRLAVRNLGCASPLKQVLADKLVLRRRTPLHAQLGLERLQLHFVKRLLRKIGAMVVGKEHIDPGGFDKDFLEVVKTLEHLVEFSLA